MTMAMSRGAPRPRTRRTELASPSEPSESSTSPEPGTATSPAQELRHRFAAVRLSIQWLGVRKTLNTDQREQAAQPFGAEGQSLSAAKKLLDTRHPAYKAVTAIRGQAVAFWKAMSLPYPEPGLRLIRQQDIEAFNAHLTHLRGELQEAVNELDLAYADLREAAKLKLGRLYDPTDYPPTLQSLFALEWDFPSIEPPNYLRDLSPNLYEQEQHRISARFDEAVSLAEEAFTSEFAKLVSHLTDRLSGHGPDGKPKVFRDSAVGNLTAFFQRFRQLNVRSNEQLDQLVEQAQNAVQGTAAQDLRTSASLRNQVVKQLQQVQNHGDSLLVDRPRRRILRPNMQTTQSPEVSQTPKTGTEGDAA